jgi:hypothetical protein
VKILKKTGWLLLGILVVTELVLRFVFGFCDAPLYIADSDFEYVYAPNQNCYRFRNVVKTNEFSMRSDPINSTDTTVILLVGDSVVNGGNLANHDDLASTILEKKLTNHYGQTVRVLNITAGSWGPDNVFAFLKKNGFFGADLVCLVTSSHDAYDNMNHGEVVGSNPNYPKENHKVALYELWDRYRGLLYAHTQGRIEKLFASSSPTQPATPPSGGVIQKSGAVFNPGFRQLADTTLAMKVPFMVYLHPETPELQANAYDAQGMKIIKFAKENNVPLIQELSLKPSLDLYRELDTIHYNEKGQAFMVKHLFPVFQQYLDRYFNANSHRTQPTVGAL